MGFLPDKPLTRTVLRISAPAVAGLSAQMVVSVVDTAMVGRLENTSVVLAAMGLGWGAFCGAAFGGRKVVATGYGRWSRHRRR